MRTTLGNSLLIAATLTACAPAAAPPPPTRPAAPAITHGREVLQAMHTRYAGRWFSTVDIALDNTLHGTDGRTTRSQWREFLAVPGRQRIDYLPLEQQSGVLYVNGRIYSFVNGRPAGEQAGYNALAVLAVDVYGQPVDSTVRQLEASGFDLSRVRRDTWRGDSVWVVGGAPGDSTTSQFWVDLDSLVVERVIQREQRGTRTTVSDVRFSDFRDAGGVPLAREMVIYRDGRLLLQQRYAGVRVNVSLPASLFDPARFSSPPAVP